MKKHGTVDFEQVVADNEFLQAVDELWRGAGYSRAGARGWVEGKERFAMTLTWRQDFNGCQRLATYTIKRLRRT